MLNRIVKQSAVFTLFFVTTVTIPLVSSSFAQSSSVPSSLHSNKNYPGRTISGAIQWVMQRAFPRSYGRNNLGRLSGVHKKNLNDRSIYGVRTKTITQTLNRSGGKNIRGSRLLGPRSNSRSMFGGRQKISGFKKSKGYRM